MSFWYWTNLDLYWCINRYIKVTRLCFNGLFMVDMACPRWWIILGRCWADVGPVRPTSGHWRPWFLGYLGHCMADHYGGIAYCFLCFVYSYFHVCFICSLTIILCVLKTVQPTPLVVEPGRYKAGYNWVGCTYSACLQVIQVDLLSSDWLQLGWLHLFYMPTGPTGGPTLLKLVTIGLVALFLHVSRSYRWTYSHQTGYNWVGCTYSTCLQVLHVGLLSSDWLQLGWPHLFYMPTGPTDGSTLIRLVTIGLAALILHAYRSYRWTYSHQTDYTWVGCTYSTCPHVLQVDLLSSDWLQLGWLHLFYMPTGPTGGLALIRLVTIGLVVLILHAYRSYRWAYSHQTGYNWVGCTYSTCLQVLQVGLLSSDWLQLGWLHLFCMPTGPTGGLTFTRLVTVGLVVLILHAYRSYRWTYSHQTGYNRVGCTYSACLQVLQVDLLSSDWCFRSQSMFHYVLVEVYRIISIYFPEVYPN